MRKTNEQQIRLGLDMISNLLPAKDFREVSYDEVERNNRFLFYYDDLLQINLSYNNPSIPKRAKVIPLLKKYMINENKNIDLIDDYINLLIKDCNPIQYGNSMLRIGSIQTICNIGQISDTTVSSYKSLNKLIPKFKRAVVCGTITIPIAVDLARLDDLSQLEIYKNFLKDRIDLCTVKISYRLLSIAVNRKLLNLDSAIKVNSAI